MTAPEPPSCTGVGLISREGTAEVSLGLDVELSVCTDADVPSLGPIEKPRACFGCGSATHEPCDIEVGRVDGSEGVDGRDVAALPGDWAFLGPGNCEAIWVGSGWTLAKPAPDASCWPSRWFEPKGVRGGVGMVEVGGEGAPDRVASLEV